MVTLALIVRFLHRADGDDNEADDDDEEEEEKEEVIDEENNVRALCGGELRGEGNTQGVFWGFSPENRKYPPRS